MVENSSLKRRLCSETDSDCEQEDQCSSPLSQGSVSGDSGCFTMARKRRRGLIEKRRRDRINRSLNDLKNLIPTAHERQASSKLEKSEVLSLAVDHIKALTAQVESTSPQSLAIDYRSIGYRECMHEMANFLIHSEGVGPAHPMHARLLSHLHQQLSGYDQVLHSAPQQPQCPRLPSAAPLQAYSSQAISSYETVTICKPEPSLSPSYCSSNTTHQYRYTRCENGYNRPTELAPSNYHWPANSVPLGNCQTPLSQCEFSSQSSWA